MTDLTDVLEQKGGEMLRSEWREGSYQGSPVLRYCKQMWSRLQGIM